MKSSEQQTGLLTVQISSPVYSWRPFTSPECHLGDEDCSPQMFLTFILAHTPPPGTHQNDHLRVPTLTVLAAPAPGKQIPVMTV